MTKYQDLESFGPKTVAILGRDPLLRAYVRESLPPEQYDPLEAANLQHAGHILAERNGRVDVILACCESDREADQIRAWHARNGRIPLVVLPFSYHRIARIRPGDIALRLQLALLAPAMPSSVVVASESDSEGRMLACVIESAGYAVRHAGNGQKAIEFFATQAPDILLTDVVMPIKDGLELIQHVHRAHPSTIVFAMCGGPRANHYLMMAQRFGATSTFKKPIVVSELLECFREVRTSASQEA